MIPGGHGVEPLTVVTHTLAGGAVLSSWTWLPPTLAGIASALAIIFYCIQIYKASKGK